MLRTVNKPVYGWAEFVNCFTVACPMPPAAPVTINVPWPSPIVGYGLKELELQSLLYPSLSRFKMQTAQDNSRERIFDMTLRKACHDEKKSHDKRYISTCNRRCLLSMSSHGLDEQG